MQKKIRSALISVYYKDGLEPVVKELQRLGTTIYSTGGTQQFIKGLGVSCVPVENLTAYPSILGGRVKTLHPVVFGGILARRDVSQDLSEMKEYNIPPIDLVIVDLYPFEETLAQARSSSFKGSAEEAEKMITEKIDIGGPSMIRAAAKNCKDLLVVAAKDDYAPLVSLLSTQNGETSFEQRRAFAARAFEIVTHYDIAISNYFNPGNPFPLTAAGAKQVLRYGENPHQQGIFYGDLQNVFDKLHGKELSYNNLVDVDAAVQLISEFPGAETNAAVFAIIKHTNVCGIATRSAMKAAWDAALAGDPESAFGGVLVCNGTIDKDTADAISEIFFEVLIAKEFTPEALTILQAKKNRILLRLKETPAAILILLPVLTNLTSAMEALVNAMLAAEQTQGTVAIGAGSTKSAKKLVLFNAASSVGKALLSFANSTNDTDLVKLMTEMLELLDRKADATFIMRCKTIHEKGVANVGSLAPYGVSDAVLTALDLTITNYEGQEQSVRNRVVARANATSAIATLQREITALLKKQIDPAVDSIPTTTETYSYKFEYKKNRLIINLGHKFTQFKGFTLNKETQTNLSNVELEFKNAERSIKIKSDNDGKYREVINPDIYDIIVSHPDFESFTIEGVKIQAGEIKVENFELVPKV